jgi:hypothetical protein
MLKNRIDTRVKIQVQNQTSASVPLIPIPEPHEQLCRTLLISAPDFLDDILRWVGASFSILTEDTHGPFRITEPCIPDSESKLDLTLFDLDISAILQKVSLTLLRQEMRVKLTINTALL